jgi:hypothetical protein
MRHNAASTYLCHDEAVSEHLDNLSSNIKMLEVYAAHSDDNAGMFDPAGGRYARAAYWQNALIFDPPIGTAGGANRFGGFASGQGA